MQGTAKKIWKKNERKKRNLERLKARKYQSKSKA